MTNLAIFRIAYDRLSRTRVAAQYIHGASLHAAATADASFYKLYSHLEYLKVIIGEYQSYAFLLSGPGFHGEVVLVAGEFRAPHQKSVCQPLEICSQR